MEAAKLAEYRIIEEKGILEDTLHLSVIPFLMIPLHMVFLHMFLDGAEGFLTDDVLHPAGILCGSLRRNTQADEPGGE